MRKKTLSPRTQALEEPQCREKTTASLLGVQTNQNRLSLHLPEASETSGLLPQVGNPWLTSCLSLPVGYTASLKKPGIDFFSAARRDVPVGVPLDVSTPTVMSCQNQNTLLVKRQNEPHQGIGRGRLVPSCIGTYGKNCKSDNVSKYPVLLVAFLLLWHEKMMSRKIQ